MVRNGLLRSDIVLPVTGNGSIDNTDSRLVAPGHGPYPIHVDILFHLNGTLPFHALIDRMERSDPSPVQPKNINPAIVRRQLINLIIRKLLVLDRKSVV